MNVSTIIITTSTLTGLFIFSIAYNRFVARLENSGHDRGYMSIIVSFGVGITNLGAAIIIGANTTAYIGLLSWSIMCASFIASGAPMIWGSINRYAQQRQHTDQESQELLKELPNVLRQIHNTGEEKPE